jgi:hypothetical protein
MSTRSRSVSSRCGRTLVLVLLTPITTLNASQALTLCVGYDGRMAVELLVQDHCTCDVRPSGTDALHDTIAGSSRITDGLGLPCLDIPIPGGSCDNRMRAGPALTNGRQSPTPIGAAGLAGLNLSFVGPIATLSGGPGDTIQSLPASVSYYAPLESILLRV